MTLRHAAAFTYGLGFGAMLVLTASGSFSRSGWVAVAGLFTVAFCMDWLANGDED